MKRFPHLDPLGGPLPVEVHDHLQERFFHGIGQGPVHHDDIIKIALLGVEAPHRRGAVQIHAHQIVPQDAPGSVHELVYEAVHLMRHSFSTAEISSPSS